MAFMITDLLQPEDETAATAQDAIAIILARYPGAVFSDIDYAEGVIWVWPSTAASQHADPRRAVAWIQQTLPAEGAPRHATPRSAHHSCRRTPRPL